MSHLAANCLPWEHTRGAAGEGKQLLTANKEGWMRRPRQKLHFQAWFHLWLEQGTESHRLRTLESGLTGGARGCKQHTALGKVWAQPAWVPRDTMSDL